MTAWPFVLPDSLEDRLLGWKRVKDMTGLSRSTAWRLQQTGAFPSPVPISTNRVAWRESELLAWKTAKLNELGTSTKRGLRSPRSPRLPGMAKVLPKPTPVTADRVPTQNQTCLDLQPTSVLTKSGKRRRKASPASIGQIDFGF